MIDLKKIREIAETKLEGSNLFLIDVASSPSNEIEVTIDSDDSVDIADCIALSRAIEEQFDREQEDFELTVTSAGIGYPLKVLRQYTNLIGSPVEVVLKTGVKIIADLKAADADTITVVYPEMRTVEGKKKKQRFEVEKTYTLSEIKSTKEYLDFK